jgi:pyruvate,water dikinase
MECEALKRARDDKGLKNVEIMIPFVRTVSELQAVNKTYPRRKQRGILEES